MMDVFKKQLPASVLGLVLDGSRLEGVVLRRSNGSLHPQQSFAAALALNPLTADPALVGREIRNHLDQANIRERRCVVCVTLNSAMMNLAEVPDLPEEDVASFLQIKAERGFHHGPESLITTTLRFRVPTGKQYAALVALPRNQVLAIEQVLRAAQLKPASISLAIAALDSADREDGPGRLSLALGETSVDLQVSINGGITALRALDGAYESDGVKSQLSPDRVAREVRITLGQLPAEIREEVREIRVYGPGELARRFTDELATAMAQRPLSIEWIDGYPANAFTKRLPPGTKVSAALSLAAAYRTGAAARLEFLPPKVKPWRKWTSRFSSRKLVWAGGAAGLVLLVAGSAFLLQKWQLARREAEWASIEPRVKELDDLQQRIKRFRPWFDESHRSLTILRKLTEAFPEEGVVTAKNLEIRELSSVTCSGVARDNQAFLGMMDKLRAAREVSDLKVDQVRGKTPMQFTFNFHWGEPTP